MRGSSLWAQEQHKSFVTFIVPGVGDQQNFQIDLLDKLKGIKDVVFRATRLSEDKVLPGSYDNLQFCRYRYTERKEDLEQTTWTVDGTGLWDDSQRNNHFYRLRPVQESKPVHIHLTTADWNCDVDVVLLLLSLATECTKQREAERVSS